MKSMKGIVRKITAALLAVGIMGATLDLSSVVYAEKSDELMEEVPVADPDRITEEVFIAMDAEGDVEHIPLDELETVDLTPLEGEEAVEYQVVVEEGGETEVVETLETLEEAEEIAEEIATEKENEETAKEEIAEEPEEEVGEEEQLEMEDDSENLVSQIFDMFVIEAQATGNSSVEVYSVTKKNEAEVVVFTDRSNTTSYTDLYTGRAGYLSAAYAPDAAYLGEENGQVIFRQAGVTGKVDSSKVSVYTYEDYTKEKITSSYTTKNGNLYHNITTAGTKINSSILVGYQQSYMKDSATYYSYDGNYFYMSYEQMVADYKAGHYKNSINPTMPYYNYYQYLSHRTTTNFTASQINQYIAYMTNSSSQLYNTGQAFIDNQNKYGVNAILMFGLAINESAWGTSDIANDWNNLFGHGAVDSNPYYGANGYSSPAESIKYHAEYFVSKQYANPKNWKYHGSHLGNKEGGMNIRYASDPYWGEKAAATGYHMEAYFGGTVGDVNKYTIGVTSSIVKAYSETDKKYSPYNTSDTDSKVVNNLPVVVLETVSAGGTEWYKIPSDAVLNSNRQTVNTSSGVYDFSRDYVYVEASKVQLISAEREVIEGGKGDTSGDGLVKSNDYLMIKDYIMGKLQLNADQVAAADVSGDGQVKSNDYLMIKDYIMGKIQL